MWLKKANSSSTSQTMSAKQIHCSRNSLLFWRNQTVCLLDDNMRGVFSTRKTRSLIRPLCETLIENHIETLHWRVSNWASHWESINGLDRLHKRGELNECSRELWLKSVNYERMQFIEFFENFSRCIGLHRKNITGVLPEYRWSID